MRLAAVPTPNFSSQLMGIPSGEGGVNETLKMMRTLVRDFKKSAPIRNLSLSLINGLGPKDYLAEIKALHAYVRDQIRYVKDINGVETLQTPLVTLYQMQGDCDDKSTLLASMLESIGHPTRFVAVGFTPNNFEHVYVETRLGPGWVSVETTEPVEVGWEPKNVVSKKLIHN